MTTTKKNTDSRLSVRRFTKTPATRVIATVLVALGLTVWTGASATNAAAQEHPSVTYYNSMVKAKKKPFSDHCWEHERTYDRFVGCKLGRNYQDFEVLDLTGPLYDIEVGKAAPGPALRDVRITTPTKFKRTVVTVISGYNQDKDGDGMKEYFELTRATYELNGGETIVVRVPVAAADPRCGGHDIGVSMRDLETHRYAYGRVVQAYTIEGVDLENPPPIQRIA